MSEPIVLDPALPESVIVALCAAASVALVALWTVRGLRDATPVAARARRVTLGLAVVAAGCLVAAALGPTRVRATLREGTHLVVVLDASRSVLWSPDDWPALAARVGETLVEGLDASDPTLRGLSRATLVAVAERAIEPVRDVPVGELASRIERLRPEALPEAGASRIGDGLERAADRIEQGGGRGAVLLVSDLHETGGDLRAAARRLARLGVPLFVRSVPATTPGAGIAGADLPANVRVGAPSHLRLWLLGPAARPVDARLEVRAAGRELPLVSTLVELDERGGAVRVAHPAAQLGIDFVDVELELDELGVRQRRRLFRHATGPIRVLGVGGDLSLTRALPPGEFEVRATTPSGILDEPQLLDDAEAIVLSGVGSRAFPPGALSRIAEAVEERGVGLFVANGPHLGTPADRPLIATFDESPLSRLLPVDPGQAPTGSTGRRVVILIDASGSMGGWPIEMAKAIAHRIIRELDRTDRLDLFVFTAVHTHLIRAEPMTEAGKSEAHGQVGRIQASGGTQPTSAIDAVAAMGLEQCGIFFISDGFFERPPQELVRRVRSRPQCEWTAFGIGGLPAALTDFAEPHLVGPDFDPESVDIGYLRRGNRPNRYEPGGYPPVLSLAARERWPEALPDESLRLTGTAVTHLKPDAELALLRFRPRDPVLAYRRHLDGWVGALTTDVPASWLDDDRGRAAVREWLLRVLPYSARDRYAFDVRDRGSLLDLRVTLLAGAPGERRRGGERIEVQLEIGGAPVAQNSLDEDPARPGTFVGPLTVPESARGARGYLVVRELPAERQRWAQRVPFAVPPRGEDGAPATAEAFATGTNVELEAELRALGARVPGPGTALLDAPADVEERRPLWSFLALAAMVFYVAQVAVARRWA